MNGLMQLDSLLIGTEDAVFELENRNSARLLVLSDTHGRTDTAEVIIRRFGGGCDALLFAGDGCPDIIACISYACRSESFRNILPPVIALVRGNGDGDKYRVTTGGNDMSDNLEELPGYPVQVSERQLLRAGGRSVFLAHGHRQRVDDNLCALISTAETLDCDMIFYGHTHRPYWEECAGSLILNPGSCSRARGGMPATFAIVEFPVCDRRFDVSFYEIKEGFGGFKFELFKGL